MFRYAQSDTIYSLYLSDIRCTQNLEETEEFFRSNLNRNLFEGYIFFCSYKIITTFYHSFIFGLGSRHHSWKSFEYLVKTTPMSFGGTYDVISRNLSTNLSASCISWEISSCLPNLTSSAVFSDFHTPINRAGFKIIVIVKPKI